MTIEKSYIAISRYFDIWVRLIEIQSRLMEIRDSKIYGNKILIISPPTDRGIKLLAQSNLNGETHLLCFSDILESRARYYATQHSIPSLKTFTTHFFDVPFDNSYFDVVFANCFFDYCQESDFDKILNEIERVLKRKGLLFSVYMDKPTDFIGRVWVSKFEWLSHGCHLVNIIPYLANGRFKIQKDLSIRRAGFPMKYLVAEKS